MLVALLAIKHRVQGNIISSLSMSMNWTGAMRVTCSSGMDPSCDGRLGAEGIQRRRPLLSLPTTANPLNNTSALDGQVLSPQWMYVTPIQTCQESVDYINTHKLYRFVHLPLCPGLPVLPCGPAMDETIKISCIFLIAQIFSMNLQTKFIIFLKFNTDTTITKLDLVVCRHYILAT